MIRGKPQFFDDLGTGTSTDAEWHALLCAIVLVQDLGLHDVEFVGDSLEVTLHANLAASTGHATSEQAAALLSLLAQNRTGRIRWIKREQNLAGIALESRRAQ